MLGTRTESEAQQGKGFCFSRTQAGVCEASGGALGIIEASASSEPNWVTTLVMERQSRSFAESPRRTVPAGTSFASAGCRFAMRSNIRAEPRARLPGSHDCHCAVGSVRGLKTGRS
jgi:hypothetical protein